MIISLFPALCQGQSIKSYRQVATGVNITVSAMYIGKQIEIIDK